MDIYDPQTLGIMVFGGFMVISAIGIALVSSFSMKETSYEEALANQRRELGRTLPQRSEKKKKEKPSEKRSRAKRKDEKPNGKLPESERVPEAGEPVSDSEHEPPATPDLTPPVLESPIVVATAAPVPVAATPVPIPAQVSAPVPAPVSAPAAPAPRPAVVESGPAPSPKDRKRKEKKVAKVEPAPTQTATAPPPKAPPVLEVVTKEVPVMAVPPVGPRPSAPVTVAPAQTPMKTEESKAEPPPRKKAASKKKAEPAPVAPAATDAPLSLPYKSLASTLRGTTLNEGEVQRLMEILSEKAGTVQGTWHTATQRGDPLAVLKKQLEEKEKQLNAEQEDAAAAKGRLRELAKELSVEKTKLTNVETRLSSQLSSREQEMKALQARMQASYQDHVAETQRLNAKIQSLQDQLEKGPNAQLARLQQENSILRDALNQATSQTESKQNAELAKLRQECTKLSKELGDKSDALLADEQQRKALEAKVVASEKQLAQVQASQLQSTHALQHRLEEVSDELRKAQSTSGSLQTELDKARQEVSSLAEVQARAASGEAELKGSRAQEENLRTQLAQGETERVQLQERIRSIEALLEAGLKKQEQEAELLSRSADTQELQSSLKEKECLVASLEEELKQLKDKMENVRKASAQNRVMEVDQLHRSLKEKEDHVSTMEKELKELKAEREQRLDNAAMVAQLQESLRDRDSQVVSLEREVQKLEEEVEDKSRTLQSDSMAQLEQLQSSLKDKEGLVTSLKADLQQLRGEMEQGKSRSSGIEQQLSEVKNETRMALQSLFPHISIETEQAHWLQEFAQRAHEDLQSRKNQGAQQTKESPELQGMLNAAEESRSILQAECDQYRTVLAETEGMLKHLQKSVEEEEHVWRGKMEQSEEQLRKALDQVYTLETAMETARTENQSTEQLRSQVMLLEAQLEKQMEAASSYDQSTSEEMTQLKQLLSETQIQLETAQLEAQKQREELVLVRQRLSEMMEGTWEADKPRGPQNGQLEPVQVLSQLQQAEKTIETEMALRQGLTEEFEQAQRCVVDLQTQLDLLKAVGSAPDTEDVTQLKERLEKEKKLSKDLGQAATKLQQLLRTTQEQLTKERDTVRKLQDQLQAKDGTDELKEGTSV
uniref:Ribosome binding protein 1a n=1 Tax=Paramormyrops kingsleyae TaxID=1676925 RepID=A0A3B3QCK1_9TELE|nr:ribosome-binding protein 1 isoform X1 [Paramormyrops kingsleyae]